MSDSVRQVRVVAQATVDDDSYVTPVAFFNDQGDPVAVGGSSSVAWSAVTGKPSTFPPTIGTTATTALAGNTAIPAAYTDAKAQAAIKGKAQIAALTAVAADADSAALATAVNAIIAALKA